MVRCFGFNSDYEAAIHIVWVYTNKSDCVEHAFGFDDVGNPGVVGVIIGSPVILVGRVPFVELD